MIIFQFSNHLFISNRRRIAKPLEWIERITFSKVFPSSWQRCHTWLRRQSKGRQPWHWNKETSETWLETRVYSCFNVPQRIIHSSVLKILVTLHTISVLYNRLISHQRQPLQISLPVHWAALVVQWHASLSYLFLLVWFCWHFDVHTISESMFRGSGPQTLRA